VYFGDHVASATVRDSPLLGDSYVTTVMGVELVGRDVRPTIDYQAAPLVRPAGSVNGFDAEFIAYGGCFGINQFDELGAGPASLASHGFVDFAIGQVYPDVAAGVVFDRASSGYRKLDVTFPFGLQYVFEPAGGSPGPRSARAQLLEEIRGLAGGSATSSPPSRRASLSVAPTPFNPRTIVRFTLPAAGSPATVRVYDVRGQLVRTLHDGPAVVEQLVLEWDGRDHRGAGVSSGVYLVEATTAGFGDTRKVVLVR
jgi:hypothetical protein